MNKKHLILLPLVAMSLASCTKTQDKFALPKGKEVNFDVVEQRDEFSRRFEKGLNESLDELLSSFSGKIDMSDTSVGISIIGQDIDKNKEVVEQTKLEASIYDVNLKADAAVQGLNRAQKDIRAATKVDDFDAKFKLLSESTEDDDEYVSIEGAVENVAASVYLKEGNLYCDFSNQNLKEGFKTIVAAYMQYEYGEMEEEFVDQYIDAIMNAFFVKTYFQVMDPDTLDEPIAELQNIDSAQITEIAGYALDFISANADGEIVKAYTYDGEGFGVEVNIPYELLATFETETTNEKTGKITKQYFTKDSQFRALAVFDKNCLLERVAVEGNVEFIYELIYPASSEEDTTGDTKIIVGGQTKTALEFAYGDDVEITYPNFSGYVDFQDIELPIL